MSDQSEELFRALWAKEGVDLDAGGFLVPEDAPFHTVEFIENNLEVHVDWVPAFPEYNQVERVNLSLVSPKRGRDLAGYFSVDLAPDEARSLAEKILKLVAEASEDEKDAGRVTALTAYVTMEAYIDGDDIVVPEPAGEAYQ